MPKGRKDPVMLPFLVTGAGAATAKAYVRQALPLFKEWGAPVDIVTVVALGESFTLDSEGNDSSASPVTLYFPPFDCIRGSLSDCANALAAELGIPCHSLNTNLIAGFPE